MARQILRRRGGHVLDPGGWTPDQREFIEKLRDDPPRFMREFILVESRDDRSQLVPLELYPAQEDFHRTLETIRAWNTFRGAVLIQDETTRDSIQELLGVELTRKRVRDAIEAITALSVNKFMRFVRGLGHRVSDGPVNVVACKGRQATLSTYIQARIFFECYFNTGLSCLVAAQEENASKNVLDTIRRIIDYWPASPDPRAEFRPEIVDESAISLRLGTGSRINAQTAGSRRDAQRSWRFDVYHLTEYAHYLAYAAIAAGLQAAPNHRWVFKESTAKGTHGRYYEDFMGGRYIDELLDAYAHGALQDLDWNNHVRWFFGVHRDQGRALQLDDLETAHVLRTLTADEQALIQKYNLTPGQIAWRRQKMADCEGSDLEPEQFYAQEHPYDPADAFQATGENVFDPKKVHALELRAGDRQPIICLRVDDQEDPREAHTFDSNLRVYEAPILGEEYVIGADVSQGVERDWHAAVVGRRIDEVRVREVALFRSRTIPPAAYGEILTMLAEWYNEAFLEVEANGPGIGTTIRIFENGYTNVYHREPLDMVSDLVKRNAFRFGFSERKETKHDVITRLQMAIRTGAIEIYSPQIFTELRAFSRDPKTGKQEGKPHDDCVIACALMHHAHRMGAPPLERREVRLKQQMRLRREQTFDDHVWAEIKKKRERATRMAGFEAPPDR